MNKLFAIQTFASVFFNISVLGHDSLLICFHLICSLACCSRFELKLSFVLYDIFSCAQLLPNYFIMRNISTYWFYFIERWDLTLREKKRSPLHKLALLTQAKKKGKCHALDFVIIIFLSHVKKKPLTYDIRAQIYFTACKRWCHPVTVFPSSRNQKRNTNVIWEFCKKTTANAGRCWTGSSLKKPHQQNYYGATCRINACIKCLLSSLWESCYQFLIIGVAV